MDPVVREGYAVSWLYQCQNPGCDFCAIVLQDVAIGENWVKITQDLFVSFLTTTYETTIICNYLRIYNYLGAKSLI